MEQEVSSEAQAAAAIKLADDVRKLIRDEVKAALEDPSFLGNLLTFSISEAVLRNLNTHSHNFQQAVKQVIIAQMNKY